MTNPMTQYRALVAEMQATYGAWREADTTDRAAPEWHRYMAAVLAMDGFMRDLARHETAEC